MSQLHRLIVLLLSFIQLIAGLFGSARGSVAPVREENAAMTLMHREETSLAGSAEYAYRVKNAAQGTYTDPARSAYRMSNADMALTHRLTGASKTASLTTPDGAVYAENTFETFYTDARGVRRYFETSTDPARVNTIRLGLYYYDCHVRDLARGDFKVDKNFHLYGDRLYAQYSLRSAVPTADVASFGSEIRIPAANVASLQICDDRGVHTGTDVTRNAVSYAAFDIKGAGVLGFIVPNDGSSGAFTVEKSGTDYVVTQLAADSPGTGINDNTGAGGYALDGITFGFRIYTDRTHSFAGIAKAAYEEHNPLSVSVAANDAGAYYAGYEALRGTYLIKMDGTGFNEAYYQAPDRHFAAPVTVENGGDGRNLYFRANGASGCLEAAALLDDTGTLAPMDVEVCKNFQGDGGEPFYSPNDYQYGDSFFPLSVPAHTDLSFTLLNLYQNWGKAPLKQLSSIEFHVSYYHLSTGVTESNCIAPYFVYQRDGWTLPDFRGRSGVMWGGQPQFNSVGVLKFMVHRDLLGRTQLSEFSGSVIASAGLAYADVTDHYTDDAGKYTYSLRHTEMPQTDENRTYYTLKVDFTDDVTYRNFRRDFDLFYFDGRFVGFDCAGWLNEANEPASAPASGKTAYHRLGTDCPYFGFYGVNAETAHYIDECFGSNFALIIKNSKIVCGGKPLDVPFAFRENGDAETTSGSLTLDAQKLSFKKGDSIEIDLVLLPWGTGRETDDANVRAVRQDSALDPVRVTAVTGEVLPDACLPIVRCENGTAAFTLSGGANNIAVTAAGFASVKPPRIELWQNGAWTAYEVASLNGYDGYSVKPEADGTYAFSFIVPAAGEPVTLRVTQAAD